MYMYMCWVLDRSIKPINGPITSRLWEGCVSDKSQRKRYIMYKNTFPVSRITTTCIVQREYYKLTPVL